MRAAILVVGATGVVGGEVCRQLARRGEAVRALVRPTSSPARVAALREAGAELLEGDLCEPESLVRACADARAVVSTATALGSRRERDTIDAVDRWGHLDLVDTAEAAGVERFVHLSLPDSAFAEPSPLSEAKRAVEYRLRASTVEWTILRPAALMEFWFVPERCIDLDDGTARVYGVGDSALSWICAADVARFVGCVLDDPRAHAAELALGGPQPLSQLEVVRLFETLAGGALSLEHVDLETLRNRMAAARDDCERSVAALMASLSHGAQVDAERLLRAYPGTLLPVQGFALRQLGAARRN